MQPYHLAKLIQWAPSGTLRSRKRMQKVVYLLQSAGCTALDAEFTLHYYGPYSQDVAALTDQMVSAGLLQETQEQNPQFGASYSYSLSDRARQLLKTFEAGEAGARLATEVLPSEATAKLLLNEDLKVLEFAATTVYFYRREPKSDWETATKHAREFKKVKGNDAAMTKAKKLAREIVAGTA